MQEQVPVSHVSAWQGLWGLLAESERETLAEWGNSVLLSPGERICSEGTSPGQVLLIWEGTAKGTAQRESGGEQLMAIYASGAVIGHVESLTDGLHTETVTAATLLHGLAIPSARFRALLSRHPRILLKLSQAMAYQLSRANQRQLDLAESSETRMSRVLLDLADRFGDQEPDGTTIIKVKLSQAELASLAGCSTVTAEKALADLRRRGVISTGYRTVRITDRATLAVLAAKQISPRQMPRTAQGRPDLTTFWDALTPGERHDLLARAERRLYLKGEVLCREDGPAGAVTVILSGWTRAWVREGTGQRIIAFRGSGELVGELATLTPNRSATLTAESDVEALRIDVPEFRAFLDAHPRVRGILDQMASQRHIKKHGMHDMELVQSNCSIFSIDIARFSSPARSDADRQYVMDAMYRLIGEAFTSSGLDLDRFYQEDRGDGAVIIVPPTTPTEAVVDPMLTHLAAALRRHNRRTDEATQIQLRAALHVGPVQRGPKGVSGISLITTRRMLDAPAVKRRLAETGADLAFVTSDFVFDTVIKHAPGFVDPSRYSRVRVRLKETALSAWLLLEGGRPRVSA